VSQLVCLPKFRRSCPKNRGRLGFAVPSAPLLYASEVAFQFGFYSHPVATGSLSFGQLSFESFAFSPSTAG
jgi:hypothetical protein